jgi:diguanylate cyclase (GGDEF)-like protein
MIGSPTVTPRLSEWISRIHPDDAAGFCSALEAHISGNTHELDVEYRLHHSDGSYRKMRTHARAVRDAAGRAFRVSGIQTDVSMEPAEDPSWREKRNGRKAPGDEAIGVVDRPLLVDRLAGAMARAGRRGGSSLAVLAVSLDRWERINERLGEEAGERMLLTAARRIAAGMRAGDTVARLNGDGFAVLLEEIENPHEAMAVAERIHRDLEEPFDLAGRPAVATASIGIVLGCPEYDRPEELLKDATTALRVARNQGGACHEIFKPSMRDGGSFA